MTWPWPRRILKKAHDYIERWEDRIGLAIVLLCLGSVYYTQGDYRSARKSLAECLALKRDLGNRRDVAFSEYLLGQVKVSPRIGRRRRKSTLWRACDSFLT